MEATSVTGPLKPLIMLSDLARQILGSGWAHRVVTTRRPNGAHQDPLREAVRGAGIDFVTVPERRVGDLGVLKHLHAAVTKFRPDIVETHDSKSHFLFTLLRCFSPALARVPWIAFHHGYTKVSARVRLYQELDRFTLRFATRVNTLCKPFAAELHKRGVRPDRIEVLTNAIQTRPKPPADDVQQVRQSTGITQSQLIVLAVGRLSQEKGHGDLINALGHLPNAVQKKIRLVLAGDGPERSYLQESGSTLPGGITFLGHVSDTWPLYCAADIFVLPSHSEGSPLVIFEAMAAGLPIVASNVGGIPEVLTDKANAMLVPARDPRSIARTLHELVDDESLRRSLGNAARENLANYSPNAYMDRVMAIYATVLN